MGPLALKPSRDAALCYVRSVLVTPTRVCPQPPSLELSNRILRKYARLSDHFLRVTFVEQDFGPFIYA